MKIGVPGGSWQVGAVLAQAFERDGHEVVILSRLAAPRAGGMRFSLRQRLTTRDSRFG